MNGNQHSWQGRLGLVLAVAALALACKSSPDAPPTDNPTDSAAGAGGTPDVGSGDAGATSTQGGAGNHPGEGGGGNVSMPGAGGAPTEPGSWDESYWDRAVWQ